MQDTYDVHDVGDIACILADFMHYCVQEKIDFEDQLEMARIHHQQETADEAWDGNEKED